MAGVSNIPVSHPLVGIGASYAHVLPCVIEVQPGAANVPLDELLDCTAESTPWREEQQHKFGAVLLRGFNALRTAEDFAALAERMAPEILDYAGGTTPRSAVTGKIVPSTDAPRHLVIGLHQEMSCLAPSADFPDPTPDKVIFFGETAPAKDGQTPLADMQVGYRKLPHELVNRFERKDGLVLRRKLPAQKRYGFEVTWKTAFSASDQDQMEKIDEQNGWNMTWGKMADLRSLTVRRQW